VFGLVVVHGSPAHDVVQDAPEVIHRFARQRHHPLQVHVAADDAPLQGEHVLVDGSHEREPFVKLFEIGDGGVDCLVAGDVEGPQLVVPPASEPFARVSTTLATLQGTYAGGGGRPPSNNIKT
tara:strand:- start:3359 stop:3727 length:369 start_codon:yes stop_codon:yes gene_type:complete